MELIPALNALGGRINKRYPNVNHGGCCVYAVVIAEELIKRGRKPHIVVGNSWKADVHLDTARNNITNRHLKDEWNGAGVFFNHVGVVFKHGRAWFVYDSDGVNPLKCGKIGSYKIYPGRLSVAEARALADESDGWNDSFNRRNISALRKHVTKFLSTNLN